MLVGIVIRQTSPDALIRARRIRTAITAELRLWLSNRAQHHESAVMYIPMVKAELSEPMPETISRLLW